jgi:hypothetical protein
MKRQHLSIWVILTLTPCFAAQAHAPLQHGFIVDLGRVFEERLNETIGRTRAPTVVFVPVARSEVYVRPSSEEALRCLGEP